MKKSDELALIVEGKNALYSRLDADLKRTDDDQATEEFMEAESVIDEYLATVEAQSTFWPDRQDLAYACAHLLVTTRTITEVDYELLGRLNSPSIGISMLAIAPHILDMRTRAEAGLKRLVEEEAKLTPKDVGGSIDTGDMPF